MKKEEVKEVKNSVNKVLVFCLIASLAALSVNQSSEEPVQTAAVRSPVKRFIKKPPRAMPDEQPTSQQVAMISTLSKSFTAPSKKTEESDDLSVSTVSEVTTPQKENQKVSDKKQEDAFAVLAEASQREGRLEKLQNGDSELYVLDRSKFLAEVTNLHNIIYDAEPELVTYEDGYGVKFNNVQENSLLADAGIQSGDTIKGLNGKAFDSILGIPSTIRNGLRPAVVNLDVERNGEAQQISVSTQYAAKDNSNVSSEIEELKNTILREQGDEAVSISEEHLRELLANS